MPGNRLPYRYWAAQFKMYLFIGYETELKTSCDPKSYRSATKCIYSWLFSQLMALKGVLTYPESIARASSTYVVYVRL